jgi:flagellar M-ring protein FliF
LGNKDLNHEPMADLRNSVANLTSRWNELRPRDRLGITVGIALIAAIAIFTAFRNSSSSMSVLFSNLSEDDLTQIGERLKSMNVPYQLAGSGGAILVPAEQVHDARLRLASEGLPSGEGVGFEIFDQQRFGESEFSEQVKYHRALEGELARTVSHLTGVQRARVHLVLPKPSFFTSDDQKASASVALRLKPGWRMKEEQVRGIVHLVASSVRGLDPERVIVVDDQGRRLTDGGDGRSDTVNQDLAIHRQIEKTKEEAVQQILDVALGAGKSAVRVAAKISFKREESTEEKFDPQTIATRSFQIVEERNTRSTGTTGGVPGTVSNLPGGEQPLPGGSLGQNGDRRSETRNFEITKLVRHAVEPVGKVEELQVAVLVDGNWKGEGTNRAFSPRTAAELDRIKAIAASAVGLDTSRGDRITVECMPFPGNSEMSGDPNATLEAAKDVVRPALPYVLGGLFVLFLTWLFSRVLQTSGRVLVSVLSPRQLQLGKSGAASLPGSDKVAETEQVRLLSANLANHEPEVAARVVRGWLAE